MGGMRSFPIVSACYGSSPYCAIHLVIYAHLIIVEGRCSVRALPWRQFLNVFRLFDTTTDAPTGSISFAGFLRSSFRVFWDTICSSRGSFTVPHLSSLMYLIVWIVTTSTGISCSFQSWHTFSTPQQHFLKLIILIEETSFGVWAWEIAIKLNLHVIFSIAFRCCSVKVQWPFNVPIPVQRMNHSTWFILCFASLVNSMPALYSRLHC